MNNVHYINKFNIIYIDIQYYIHYCYNNYYLSLSNLRGGSLFDSGRFFHKLVLLKNNRAGLSIKTLNRAIHYRFPIHTRSRLLQFVERGLDVLSFLISS